MNYINITLNLTRCDRCAHCITKCPNVASVTYICKQEIDTFHQKTNNNVHNNKR